MPLNWMMSSFMIIFLFLMLMIFYGNFMEYKKMKIFSKKEGEFKKWLW